eukprot:TRINITY_DN255_c0_g1_i2.p1 TRINITY_DN255_c0_g1~~TRINITY_DN255_c0_g1_i2.p1  ORF type:complete len:918 (-),score=229.35 TRINITY_DN255_c0_g1_i2:292-3045(-)
MQMSSNNGDLHEYSLKEDDIKDYYTRVGMKDNSKTNDLAAETMEIKQFYPDVTIDGKNNFRECKLLETNLSIGGIELSEENDLPSTHVSMTTSEIEKSLHAVDEHKNEINVAEVDTSSSIDKALNTEEEVQPSKKLAEFSLHTGDEQKNRINFSEVDTSSSMGEALNTEEEEQLSKKLAEFFKGKLSEGYVEEIVQVIKEQKSHDLLCPVCGSCVTKRVILRKRKRTNTMSVGTHAQLADHPTGVEITESENAMLNSALNVHDDSNRKKQSKGEFSSKVFQEPAATSSLSRSEGQTNVHEQHNATQVLRDSEDDEVFGCLSCFSIFFKKATSFEYSSAKSGKSDGRTTEHDDEGGKIECFYCIPFQDWWSTRQSKEGNEVSAQLTQTSIADAKSQTKPAELNNGTDLMTETKLSFTQATVIRNMAGKVEVIGESSESRPIGEKDSTISSGSSSLVANSISKRAEAEKGSMHSFHGKEASQMTLLPDDQNDQCSKHPIKGQEYVTSAQQKQVADEKHEEHSLPAQTILPNQIDGSSEILEGPGMSGYNDTQNKGRNESTALLHTEHPSMQNLKLDDVTNNTIQSNEDKRFCSCFPSFVSTALSICSERKSSKDGMLKEPLLPKVESDTNAGWSSQSGSTKPIQSQHPLLSGQGLKASPLQKAESDANDPSSSRTGRSTAYEVTKLEDYEVSDGNDKIEIMHSGNLVTSAESVIKDGNVNDDHSSHIVDMFPDNSTRQPLQMNPLDMTTQWEILKSIVYGGLPVSISSLAVVSSAAGGEAKTRMVVAISLSNLIAGLMMVVTNILHLNENEFTESVGHSFWFNGSMALLSYLVVGSLAPITYGLSFRKSNDILHKFLLTSGVSLITMILLALGKARVAKRSYIRTVTLYVITGFWASVAGFFAGEYIKKLLEKWGVRLD